MFGVVRLAVFFYGYGAPRDLHSFPTRRLPISVAARARLRRGGLDDPLDELLVDEQHRSEEHTSELQSLTNLVCRLLLEKKNQHLRRLAEGPGGVLIYTRRSVRILPSGGRKMHV